MEGCRQMIVTIKKDGEVDAELDRIKKQYKSVDRFITYPKALLLLAKEAIRNRRLKELEECR